MKGAFHIRRIRLLNFHNFVDETLSVRRNLFLIPGIPLTHPTPTCCAVCFADLERPIRVP